MASSIVSEGIVLVAVVIAAAALSQVFLTSMAGLEHGTLSMTDRLSDKMKTSIDVISAVNTSSTTVKVWVKNTGTSIIPATVVEMSDIIFGRIGEYSHVQYAESGPGWDFIILNSDDTNWQDSETIEITITTSSELAKGDYYFRFNTHNGVDDELYFTIGD
jgi:archaellum component FlaG (FlaF/FlaG flagellin family)